MGKGSQGKKFFKTKRKIREKRIKRGELGPAYTPPLEEKLEPKLKYGKGKVEIEGGILPRKHEEKISHFYTDLGQEVSIKSSNYITPENTKTKKGRRPQIVNEEDIPSYLLNHCLKQAKDEKGTDYCKNECPLGADCEGTLGNIFYPSTHTVKGFKALYPDKEVKMLTIGITL